MSHCCRGERVRQQRMMIVDALVMALCLTSRPPLSALTSLDSGSVLPLCLDVSGRERESDRDKKEIKIEEEEVVNNWEVIISR